MIEKTPKSAFILERLSRSKWAEPFRHFYAEPLVIILMVSMTLSGTVLKDQILIATCETVLNYNESICEKMGTMDTNPLIQRVETEVQSFTARLLAARTTIEHIVPAVCGLFIGSWADYYGRKPLLTISLIGFFLSAISLVIISVVILYIRLSPWYFIIPVLPHSILGGNCVFAVAVYCIVADVTNIKTRPFRMIFFDAAYLIGSMTGTTLSSFVYNATNATTVFTISTILLGFALVFLALYVPETLNFQTEEKEVSRKNSIEKTENSKDVEKVSDLKMSEVLKDVPLTDSNVQKKQQENASENDNEKKKEDKPKKISLLSLEHLKEMIRTCLKPRECYDRAIIWLITLELFICTFVYDGGIDVLYLFVRQKFQWSLQNFTLFETASKIITFFGSFAGILIFRKFFGVSVLSLVLLALFSAAVSTLIKGLATESWHLYLAAGLAVFRALNFPMSRTIVSSIVPSTDIGKIFAIKNILTSLAPFIASPLYASIYTNSISTFPGLFFIVSTILYTIAFMLSFCIVIFKFKCKNYYGPLLK